MSNFRTLAGQGKARNGLFCWLVGWPFSAHQLPQKFPLVHAVLEGLASVNEYNRNFIVEQTPQFAVGVHIHFLPDKSAAARELGQALLDHFAKMTALARVNHDLA